MPDPPDIFGKRRLTIGQVRAVADRRYGDAMALVDTGDNARANGAQYLSGIVIEILLKGQLLKFFPNLNTPDASTLSPSDRELWNLVWRSHDLEAMLDRLPQVRVSVDRAGLRAGQPYWKWLVDICGRWTIFARYSPASSTLADARTMIDRVRILKEALR